MNIIKMSILPKAIYRFSAICIKVSMAFFRELEQTMLKFTGTHKNPPNSHRNLEKEERRGIMLPVITLHYKATVIRMAWDWRKNRHDTTLDGTERRAQT